MKLNVSLGEMEDLWLSMSWFIIKTIGNGVQPLLYQGLASLEIGVAVVAAGNDVCKDREGCSRSQE